VVGEVPLLRVAPFTVSAHEERGVEVLEAEEDCILQRSRELLKKYNIL
jgi:hypothetical protein